MCRLLLLLLLVPVACRARIQPERESELYAGVGVSGLPQVGGTFTAGQYFWKRHPRSDFAFELRGTYQPADDSPSQDGKFAQIQAGVKQVAAPGHPRGFVFRYGVTWFRATGDPDVIDGPGDYLGVYGGIGYEWRVGRRWTLGPEILVNVVDGEGSVGGEVLPQAGFHVLFDF